MIREYLIKNFDNQRSKKIILYNKKEKKNFIVYFSIVYCMILLFFVHN